MIPDLDDAGRMLREVFGFSGFRAGQDQVVARLLRGRSTLAIFPTGGGKSLCYQLPALLLEGLTVVVSPLIALMKDQVDFLVGRGVDAARLDSSLEAAEARRVFEGLRTRRLKLLYVAPERLASERFVRTLAGQSIALLAIDEAHCISAWGHNFRPEYLKLAELARQLNVGRVLALTATATPEVARDVAASFGIAEVDVVSTGFHRPNLELHATPCRAEDRLGLLLERLETRSPGPTIVYVTLQKTAEELAEALTRRGLDALAYHAGLGDERRHQVQDAFMASDSRIIVATIAFGMGIDKSNIRAVFHYNLPKGPESYAQEIGRAGRDGLPAHCELFASSGDVTTLENFAYGDTPSRDTVEALLADVLGRGAEFDVSIHDLAFEHDMRPLVVRTLLTRLELEGILESTGPFHAEYKLQPQRSVEEILGRFDARRAAFLGQLFAQARAGRTWLALDVAAAAEALGEPRARIVTALNYLEEEGDLVLQLKGVRQGYRRLRCPSDLERLGGELTDRFRRHEERDVARVHQMLAFAEASGCLTRRLLSYFGEELPGDCGHCGPCLGTPRAPLSPRVVRPLGETEREWLAELRAERHPALAHPRQVARFLCGLSSPRTTRARLSNHRRFSALADVPFPVVLALAEG